MKKTSIFLAATFVALAFASCAKEELEPEITPETNASLVFTANTYATKTTLSSDDFVLWQAGDQINVNGKVYNISEGSGTARAKFVAHSEDAVKDGGFYYAFYPESISYNGGSITLPETQTYANNAGLANVNPMFAKSDDETLSFKNICALIELNLKGNRSVRSITISADEKLSGAATFDASTLALTATGSNRVTLNCGAGVALTEGGTKFYIALPGNIYNNFTITVEDTGGLIATKTLNNALKLERAMIRPITWTPSFYGVFAVCMGPDGIAGTADDLKVKFSQGNLYYDGSLFQFEANQYDFRHVYNGDNKNAVINGQVITTPANHVGTFYYSNTASVAYNNGSYIDNDKATTDILFTNDQNQTAAVSAPNANFTVNGQTGKYRALTSTEWTYLFNNRTTTTTGMTGNAKYAMVKIAIKYDGTNDLMGLLLFPDSFAWNATTMGTAPASVNSTTVNTAHTYSIEEFGYIESAGAVFLPAAGSRNGSYASNVGTYGNYWSSSPHADNAENAYYVYFGSDSVFPSRNSFRSLGFSVRLVTDVK